MHITEADLTNDAAVVWGSRCAIKSCVHGGDGVNDYELVVYDTVTNPPAGTEKQVIPKAPFDASAYSLNGSEKTGEGDCAFGAIVVITAIGGGAFGGSINLTIDVVPG